VKEVARTDLEEEIETCFLLHRLGGEDYLEIIEGILEEVAAMAEADEAAILADALEEDENNKAHL